MRLCDIPAALLLFAATVAACGGGDGGGSTTPTGPAPSIPATPTPPGPVASVTVSPENASVIAGDTVRLSATARDAAGREVSGVTFAWKSSDEATATVAASGLVTAIAPGEARITVTANDKQSASQLTATPRIFAHGTIAFISERHGTPEIYLIGPTGERRLTNNSLAETRIAWSPDGTRIAFEDAPLRGQRTRSIYVINADGTGETRLTNPPESSTDFNPQWSPNGVRLTYWRTTSRGGEIRLVNADGTGDVRVVGGSGTLASAPAWSPDGSHITFFAFPYPPGPGTDRSDIYIVNTDGTGLKNLTNTPGVSDEYPRWSPDGRKIAFDSWLEGGPQVHTINPDGSGVVRLTMTQWFERAPVWSPDSRLIAFISSRDRGLIDFKEVYVMNTDGSAQRRLTTMRWFVYALAWSPDAARLVFGGQLENPQFTDISNRWDRYHVYVVNVDGTGLVRVTGAGTNDYNPAWRP